MLHFVLLLPQIAVLIAIGVVLWQIWRFLNRKDIPEDEPLGEARAKYLTSRFNILKVCFLIEAILTIVQTILRLLKAVS